MNTTTLYQRLGGYDAIAAVTDALMLRIKADDKLRRFYDHRGADGIAREQQLLVDFLCAATGGSMVYTGRDMKSLHVGMRLDEDDWQRTMNYSSITLESFGVPTPEKNEVMNFLENLKADIVEV